MLLDKNEGVKRWMREGRKIKRKRMGGEYFVYSGNLPSLAQKDVGLLEVGKPC